SRLKLPIYGANFPLHFMLYYESKDFKSYIDPFHGGVLVNRDICKKFLEANGFPTAPEDYHKPSTVSILKRMLNNLIHNHRKMGKIELEKIYSSQLLALQ
ncbi:MAG: transglutaminase, partial [Leptospiraceae bacterium]|nr:transglutaminase [Leptospiraceae bacterium]